MTYTVSVTSRDNAGCAPSTFSLQTSVPAGWTVALASPSITPSPGATASTTLQVTSPASTPAGSYTIGTSATNSSAASYTEGWVQEGWILERRWRARVAGGGGRAWGGPARWVTEPGRVRGGERARTSRPVRWKARLDVIKHLADHHPTLVIHRVPRPRMPSGVSSMRGAWPAASFGVRTEGLAHASMLRLVGQSQRGRHRLRGMSVKRVARVRDRPFGPAGSVLA